MKFKLWFITLIIFLTTSAHGAERLKKVELNEDDILLLDVAINRETIASAVDAYKVNDKVLIAIEPVFDSLKLRYQLTEKQLTVWKDEEVKLFDFVEGGVAGSEEVAGLWATDGYYQFIEIDLLRKVFGVIIKTDLLRQMIIFSSDEQQLTNVKEPHYLFPVQKLALLNERRQLNRFYNSNTGNEEITTAITIGDQYRLLTPPHGRVSLAANLADKQFNGSVQLVSDFLYHSTNLTLSKSDQTDLAASMTMARFKSSPEDRIFGLFDSYRIGDVSGVANNLTTDSNSGLGIMFQRSPDNFRRKNLEITLEELAPPGWDAELFRSGVFLGRRVVPADGRLIYENVELFYGLNDFEIRLYGPYGEEDIINNRINVKQNPLAAGQMAYSINALDKNHRMFNNTSDESYGLTNFGGSFDYGINERWQLGVAFASIDSEQQFLSVKNALSFNNFLFENDLSVNQDGSYAQQTSLTGSLFYKDNYTLRFESAKDYASETIDAIDDSLFRLSGSYSVPTYIGLTRFSAGYQESDSTNRLFVSNQLSNSLGPLYLTHTLTYSKYDLSSLSSQFNEIESLQGNLSLSANLPSFFISASLSYDPEKSDFLQDSSSITIRKTIKDPYENRHYLQAQYFPLNAAGRKWAIRHNMAMQSEKYQMTLSSSFDSNDDWSVQLGVQFFLGYDYRNNSFIIDREFSGGSATLDVHTYLDRQVNGVPDPLDFDLADVRFTGNPRWKEYRSNDEGRTILPGVYANSEFAFGAAWQDGSATINNDYVVYTHPGALVDVNMPFYLITDLTGFVVRQQVGQEIALRNVQMELLDADNQIIETSETDQDGYYEFLNLGPNSYRVRVADDFLQGKAFTSDSIGFKVATSGRGGFVELPTLILRRTEGEVDRDVEELTTYILNEENVDALVWAKDEELNKNYFTLPRKDKGQLRAKYSLSQEQQVLTVEKPLDDNDKLKAIETEAIVPQQTEVKVSLTQVQNAESNNSLNKPESEQSFGQLPRLRLVSKKTVNNVAASGVNAQFDDEPLILILEGEDDIPVQSGWTIQFSANSAEVDEKDAIETYARVGALYVAQKVTADGRVLYCLISQNFDSKNAASVALNSSGFAGWVTQGENFTNVKKIL